jgi:hypothetical protein
MSDRVVRVVISADASAAIRSFREVEGGLNKVGDGADKAGKTGAKSAGEMTKAYASTEGSMRKVGAASIAMGAAGALAGAKVIDFLRDSVTAASDLNETVSKAGQIFRSASGSVMKWSQDAAKNLGLSKAAALDAAANFGNMFTQLGYTSKAAADMSTKVVQMSADLGSFNNMPTADVADKISAAFRGEFDSLQALIPNINAARVQQEAMAETGKANADSLTAQEKAAAVLAIVQRDGATAMGDYARTADGFANSTKTATARIADQQAEIGQKLMPVWQGALELFSDVGLPILSGFADGLGAVVGAVQAVPGPVLLAGAALATWKLLDGPITGFLSNVNTKMKAISTEAPTMGAKAKLAGGAMLGAFGGPVGVALAGLTLGIGFLGKRLEGTEIATRDFKGAIDELSGAIDQVKLQEIVGGDTLAKMQAAGVAAGDYTLALSGNEDAIKRVHAALVANVSAQEGASDDWYRANALLGQFKSDAYGVVGGLNAWEAAQRETTATVEKAPAPTKAAEDSTKKLRDEYDKTAYAAGGVAGQVATLMQMLDEQAGRNGDAEAAQRAFNGSMRDYAEAQRDIPAATRDVEQAQADLTTAQKALTTAQGEHGKKSAEAKQAARDLADAEDRLASAQLGQGAAADAAAQKADDLQQNYLTVGQQAYNFAMAQGNVTGATKAAEDALRAAKDEWIKAQPEQDKVSGKAKEMADKLFGIPKEVATTITATDNASRVVAGVLTALDLMPRTKQIDIQLKASGYSGAQYFDASTGTLKNFEDGGAVAEAGRYVTGRGTSGYSAGAGAGLTWAEAATDGEYYLSMKASQKDRNRGLASDAVAELGGKVDWGSQYARQYVGPSTAAVEASQLRSLLAGLTVGGHGDTTTKLADTVNITTADPDVMGALNRGLFKLGGMR